MDIISVRKKDVSEVVLAMPLTKGHKVQPKLLGDVISVAVAFLISCWQPNLAALLQKPTELIRVMLVVVSFSIAGFWLIGLYERRHRVLAERLGLIALAVVFSDLAIIYFDPILAVSVTQREILIPFTIGAILLVFTWRTFISRLIQGKKIVIVCDDQETVCVTDVMKAFERSGFNISQVITIKDFESNVLDLQGADAVCISSSIPDQERRKIINSAVRLQTEMYIVPGLNEIMLREADAICFGDTLLFRVSPLGLNFFERFLKRLFDISLTLIGLAIAFWIFPIVALSIKLDSAGPIFYSQTRVGQDGKLFELYKFRTMINGAENETGPVLATESDQRITRVGRILRSSRIDELPQLWNVLKGDMSLVGPRPERPRFVEKFSKEEPVYENRLKVKPGITGLAQVEGSYSTGYKAKMRFDLTYIRNYSLLLDVAIVIKTIGVVLTPERAKGFRTEHVPKGETQAAITSE